MSEDDHHSLSSSTLIYLIRCIYTYPWNLVKLQKWLRVQIQKIKIKIPKHALVCLAIWKNSCQNKGSAELASKEATMASSQDGKNKIDRLSLQQQQLLYREQKEF